MQFYKVPIPPIFPPTIALIAGIGAQAYMVPFHNLLIGCIIILFFVFWFAPKNISLFFAVFWCFTASLWGYLWPLYKINDHRAFSAQFEDHIVTIEGVVKDKEKNTKGAHALTLDLISIATNTRTIIPKNRTLKIYTLAPEPMIGDTVRCQEILWHQSPNENRERYVLREGLATTLYAQKKLLVIIKKAQGVLNKLYNKINTLRFDVVDKLRSKMSPACHGLFNTLLLGASIDQFDDMEDIKNNFVAWGIAHQLSRSGLHIVIIIMLWQAIFRLLALGFLFTQLLLFGALGLFWLLSWPSIAFARAVIAYVIAQLTIAAKIQPHPIHLITLTCLIVLILNPFHLFFLSFQLSFLLAWILALYHEIKLLEKRSLAPF